MQEHVTTTGLRSVQESVCPGCGLGMPISDKVLYDGYFNTSQECWSLFTEVVGAEFSNPFLFGRGHQLTVDSYAVQHAGGKHPDKSVVIHLAGLYLMLEKDVPPTRVPRLHQGLADSVSAWPHFSPPSDPVAMTVFDVALCDSVDDHIRAVRDWARTVWKSWSPHHQEVRDLVARYIDIPKVHSRPQGDYRERSD